MAAMLTILVLMALGGAVKAEQCPFEPKCNCSGTTINCGFQGLTSIPEGINTWNADQVTVV